MRQDGRGLRLFDPMFPRDIFMPSKPEAPDIAILEKPEFGDTFFKPLADARRIHGKPILRHGYEIVRFCLWKKYFTRADYYTYGFHKERAVSDARAGRYVGNTRNVQFIRKANRLGTAGRAILNNKVLTDIVLRSADIRTEPIIAAFASDLPPLGGQTLASAEDLAGFLRAPDRYPLFGKPCAGVFSSGVISLDRCDLASDSVVTREGSVLQIEALARSIATRYRGGYLFQKRIVQHPDVRQFSGETVSSLRVLTINDGTRQWVHYAIWKLASAESVADNSWRPGVAFCMVDPGSGAVARAAIRPMGVNEQTEHHPATGIRLIGAKVPLWDAVQTLACRAAAVLPDVPVIGWDIAITPDGPLIIEGAEDPGPALYQMVMEEGVLTDEFLSILDRVAAIRRQRGQGEPSGVRTPLRDRRNRWLRKFDIMELLR
jgi:hypothetical protein